MTRMRGDMNWREARLPFLYAVMGVLGGLLFPAAGTYLEVVSLGLPRILVSFVYVQQTQPLLWIIDLAPGVLGILAALLGFYQNAAHARAVSESEIQAIFNSTPDPIFLAEPGGCIFRYNEAARLAHGEGQGSLVGNDLYHELGILPASQVEGPNLGTSEIIWLGRTYSCHVNLLRSDPPQSKNLIVVLHDITESKRAGHAADRQKQFFEAVVDNSPTAIVVLDNDGRIRSSNPAFEELFGYTKSEVIGVGIDTLITTPETLHEAIKYTQLAMDRSLHAVGNRRRKDGSMVQVEISAVPVFVGDEKVGALGIYHDITALLEAREEAEQASQAKSEFLANMSHEIRTPMNGVIGMLELVLDTPLRSEQSDYLQTALQSAEALMVLLNDILDFSKIEAGKLELDKIHLNLRNIVEEVAYTMAKRAQDKGLEIACQVNQEMPANLIGDPGRLRQILVNLVGNAIKFTQKGEIVIRAEKTAESPMHVSTRISVHDTGIGIPPEKQAAIFERFTQADGSTTRNFGGTGLGLTICKQLVDMMGGKIGVDSTQGEGSTFWFEIPLEKKIKEKGDTAPLFRKPAFLASVHSLVVDDNQTNRTILVKNLEAMGCRCEAVSGGAAAVEILRKAHRSDDRFDLVLLDRKMPGMDGEQTLRAIMSDPTLKDLKVIILTSMSSSVDADHLLNLGCASYLYKPVKQQILFETVISVLEEVERPKSIAPTVSKGRNRSGQRILLAEDNSINQKLAMVLMRRAGYEVNAVETGIQAFEQVRDGQYNAILMDVQMPVMNGLDATKKIREWEADNGGHIPIIAMTAHAMQGDRERCLDAGMDDYVSKPLQPQVLFAALDRWLPEGEARQEDDFDGGNKIAPEISSPSLQNEPVTGPPTEVLPINIEATLQFLSGDREFMVEMLLEYQKHLPERLMEIRSALQAGDADLISLNAHNLKGVSLNLSIDRISRLASELEEAGNRRELDRAGDIITLLEEETHRLDEYLKNFLQ